LRGRRFAPEASPRGNRDVSRGDGRCRAERVDQGELITIPSLPDAREWDAFNSARVALGRNLSRNHAADRYKVEA
jgi:hypothetical protein